MSFGNADDQMHVYFYEREVELGGPIHSKGVLILSGFLGERYGGSRPLAVHASVVFRSGWPRHEGTVDDLLTHCRAQLAPYKIPAFIRIREQLPMSAVGKILYRVLREEAVASAAAELSIASTRLAPLSMSAFAPFWIVPAVSMMSSAMMQTRPCTSPTTFITSAVPSSERRLSITANSASSRLAYARARSAPPASGETIVSFGCFSRAR